MRRSCIRCWKGLMLSLSQHEAALTQASASMRRRHHHIARIVMRRSEINIPAARLRKRRADRLRLAQRSYIKKTGRPLVEIQMPGTHAHHPGWRNNSPCRRSIERQPVRLDQWILNPSRPTIAIDGQVHPQDHDISAGPPMAGSLVVGEPSSMRPASLCSTSPTLTLRSYQPLVRAKSHTNSRVSPRGISAE